MSIFDFFRKKQPTGESGVVDYNSYAAQCVEELKVLQSNFESKYDLTWYEDWFCDQETGLLTFSTGESKLCFRYFQVGSFSERSNTWKWAWDNPHVLDHVKEKSNLVRTLGEKLNFRRLTQGLLESDEAEGWEFAAIAAKLAGGIGVYRPLVDDHLKIFLVITEWVDDEMMKRMEDKYIRCNRHGYLRLAFVCQHLNFTTKVGFREAFETSEGVQLSDEDDFQAWCNECEKVRQKASGWNEESMAFANIKLVCTKCYFEMKAFNLE